MKLIVFMLISVTCNAQLEERLKNYKPASTTQEEYNYLTKGYKETIEKGLDIKKGYLLNHIFEYSLSQNYTFTFKQFVREQAKELAGTLVIAKSKVWGNVYYICIPNEYGLLFEDYYKTIGVWDKYMLHEYLKAYTAYTIKSPHLTFLMNAQ